MSWTGLQVVTWADVPFWVQSIGGDWRRRIVRYSYPLRDGADSDDLGREPVTFTVSALIFGPSYQDEFRALLTAFQGGGVHNLVHPAYGSIAARLVAMRDRLEADSVDQIALDLTFEEDGADALAFADEGDTLQASADAATDALFAAIDAANATLGVQ